MGDRLTLGSGQKSAILNAGQTEVYAVEFDAKDALPIGFRLDSHRWARIATSL